MTSHPSLLRRAHTTFGGALAGQRGPLIESIALSIGIAAVELARPWPVKFVIDYVVLPVDGDGFFGWSPLTVLTVSCITVFAIAASLGTLNVRRTIRVAEIGRRVATRVRRQVFEHVHRLGLPFHQESRTGDLLVRLSGDVNLVRDFMVASWINIIGRGALFIAMAVVMFCLDPLLAAIAILPLPFLFIRIRRSSEDLTAVTKKQRRREGAAVAIAAETLRHIPIVKAYASEDTEAARFARQARSGERAGVKAARLAADMARWTEMITALGLAAVLFVGARRAMLGFLTPGELIVLLSYARSIYKPLRGLAREGVRLAKSAACTSRLLEVMEREPEGQDDGVSVSHFEGAIDFRDVSFAYPGGENALSDVDVSIPAGSFTVIRGANGAGKSTLISLLLRLHAPTAGSIDIDGQPIDSFCLADYRAQFAYVPQNLHLLGTTVRENLLYGRPDADDTAIIEALEHTHLTDVVARLPDGIDTVLGEDGASFSGGEARRVMLARAAIREASVLVFDEPLAGLDHVARAAMIETVRRIATGRTAIVISHDAIEELNADTTIALDGGRVVPHWECPS